MRRFDLAMRHIVFLLLLSNAPTCSSINTSPV
jgi:hypothetical protein